MCANYIPPEERAIEQHFAAIPKLFQSPRETYPMGMAPIIRHAHRSDAIECVDAMFGIVPHWAEKKLARSTYNARSETAATKPSFRNAWKLGQFCIIPTSAFFEPNWESGKAVRWQINHRSERPLGLAGLWEWKADQDGVPLLSFSMLTINADGHALMDHFHKPGDEKRMVVVLEPDQYHDWLAAKPIDAPDFLRRYPAESLIARPAPRAPTVGDERRAA